MLKKLILPSFAALSIIVLQPAQSDACWWPFGCHSCYRPVCCAQQACCPTSPCGSCNSCGSGSPCGAGGCGFTSVESAYTPAMTAYPYMPAPSVAITPATPFWAAPVWQPVQPVWQPVRAVAQPTPAVIETVRPAPRPVTLPAAQSVNSAWRPVPSATTYSSPAPIVQYR